MSDGGPVREVILHVGPQKTGTTSFQAVMCLHRDAFLDAGLDPFRTGPGDKVGRARHGDITLSVLRAGIWDQTPGQALFGVDQAALKARTRAALAAHLGASRSRTVLVSAESLYLLRTRKEMSELRALFPATVGRFRILATRRPVDDWRRSFRSQLLKTGVALSDDPNAYGYLEPDSWLWRFDEAMASFAQHLGPVQVVEYDPEDMVAVLCEALGVRIGARTSGYRRNVSPRYPGGLRGVRALGRRIFGNEDQGLTRILRHLREARATRLDG